MPTSFSIYTEELFFWPRLKNWVKTLLGNKQRGPQAVVQSLERGLTGLGVSWKKNAPVHAPQEIVCVLSGVRTLRWAIEQKKKGNIKKLVAGPNIVVTPLEAEALAQSPEIDLHILPSPWIVNWWLSLAPGLAGKITSWGAGVEDRGVLQKKDGKILVFQKNAPDRLLSYVIKTLTESHFPYEVLRYGTFTPQEYGEALSHSRGMVYLSKSESQGLALHEAWMANVPTLVWNPGVLQYRGFTWSDPKLSAPYLTDATGMFFSGEEDFALRFREYISRLGEFSPRSFSLEQFTDQLAAKQFVGIVQSVRQV